MSYVERNCNICSSDNYRQIYSIVDYKIVECLICGFKYLNPSPTQTPYDIYEEEYYTGNCSKKDTYNVTGWDYFVSEHYSALCHRSQKTVDVIENLVRPGNILDIGCGIGIFLAEARNRGWSAYGFDTSEFAINYAKNKLGLENVKKMDVQDIDYQKNSFDVITMFHVIEHVLYPKELLKKCYTLLKPGGILLMETPDISSRRAKIEGESWRYLKIPEHLNYFSLKTLLRLTKQIGLKPINIKREVESTGLLIKLCGRKEEARKFYDLWITKKWFRFAVEKISAFKGFVSGTIFKDYDTIQVICRKR